jgi:hypothetical protein
VSSPGRFEVVHFLSAAERIASGPTLRARRWLNQRYGRGDWVKRKALAPVRFDDGTIRRAEVHWYEAHGIGKKNFKIKRTIRSSPP